MVTLSKRMLGRNLFGKQSNLAYHYTKQIQPLLGLCGNKAWGAAASCEHDAKKKLEDLPIGQVEDVVHRFWIVADAGVPVVDNLTRSLLLLLREVVVACRDFKVSG